MIKIIREELSIQPPYSNILIDVIEYDNWPGLMWLTIYERNLDKFSDQQKLEILNWLSDCIKSLHLKGVNCQISLEE